jgi:hypothetical protein
MKLIFRIVPTAAIVMLVLNCSNSDPSLSAQPDDKAPGNQTHRNLRILFQWPGDDFATKQQIETRDKIKALISEQHIGQVIQSGSGMGWMDIVIEVEDKNQARRKIEKIIKEASPDAKFTILWDSLPQRGMQSEE